ncbi:MAG: radical SAM protein [Elusimicrobia bacterium]|nr:radical SAM protein [Elusimicrobiota bacterium]
MSKEKKLSNLLYRFYEKKENKFSVLLEIAKTYFDICDYENSLKFYLLAADHKENNNKEFIFLEIGKIYRLIEKNDKALEYLFIVKNSNINNEIKVAVNLEIANAYINKNNFKEALKYLEYVVKNSVGEQLIICSIILAKVYRSNHQYEKALDILDTIYDKDSKYKEETNKIRNIIENEMYDRFPGNYNFNGNYQDLIANYKKILKDDPSNGQVLCFLSQAYNYMGLYDCTIELYEKNREKITKNKFFKNKFLNEYEIASKKTILSSKPRNLMVVLSNKCNIRCIMCMTSRSKWELPKDRLNEIIELFPYLERVMWQGGEILLLPYFKDMLKQTTKYKNLRQSMISNFQLANEEIINLIVTNNVELTISIDGVCKETYESIRVGGSFEKLTNNLQMLLDKRNKIENKMILNMNVVVMRENYYKLSDFVDFAYKYKFDFICFMQLDFVPKDNVISDVVIKKQQDFFNDKDEIEMKILSYQMMLVEQKAKKYGIRVESRLKTKRLSEIEIKEYEDKGSFYKQYIKNKKIYIEKEINEQYNINDTKRNLNYNIQNGITIDSKESIDYNSKIICNNENKNMLCHLPWYSLTLDFDGSVRPDCQCSILKNVGHLKDCSINEIWNNTQMQYYRKKIINNDYKDLCSDNCIKKRIVNFHLKLL